MTDDAPEQPTTKAILKPRVYVNGFPKSGLHRVCLLADKYCTPAISGLNWAGTFLGNAWTSEWEPEENYFCRFARLVEGTYLRGHAGYSPEIERFLWHLGAGCVFVYRDLRDVLVSQTYHSRSLDKKGWSHPEKELFAEMTFEQAMVANLVGIQGEQHRYASLRERWELYAPWLDVEWVLRARFEETLEQPQAFATAFARHFFTRFAEAHGDRLEADDETWAAEGAVIAPAMDDYERSPTFRKGTAGQWREEFTPYVTRLFKVQLGDWLVRLGYEEGDDW